MPTSKPKPPPPRVTIEADESGPARAVYALRTYRFMFNDGTTLDVVAHRDDSDLRAAVLAHTKADKIEGVAWLD